MGPIEKKRVPLVGAKRLAYFTKFTICDWCSANNILLKLLHFLFSINTLLSLTSRVLNL